MTDDLPHTVSRARRVEAPPDAVWALLSDFHGVDRWAPLVVRVSELGDVAAGPGMARRCELRWLGRVDEVVNVWEPGARIGYRVTALGPVQASQSLWVLEPDDQGGTCVRLRLAYRMRFGILGRLLDALVVRRILARNLRGALALLRRHLLSEERPASDRIDRAGPGPTPPPPRPPA